MRHRPQRGRFREAAIIRDMGAGRPASTPGAAGAQGFAGATPARTEAWTGFASGLSRAKNLFGLRGTPFSRTSKCRCGPVVRPVFPTCATTCPFITTSGEVWFEGRNVVGLAREAMRALCRDMQIIFQDPYASLDPRMTVGAIVGEALVIHNLTKPETQYRERIVELLETVGLHADQFYSLAKSLCTTGNGPPHDRNWELSTR